MCAEIYDQAVLRARLRLTAGEVIAWIGLHERVGERVTTVLSDDKNVGSACLLDDKPRRVILGAPPFHNHRTLLHHSAKLRFHP